MFLYYVDKFSDGAVFAVAQMHGAYIFYGVRCVFRACCDVGEFKHINVIVKVANAPKHSVGILFFHFFFQMAQLRRFRNAVRHCFKYRFGRARERKARLVFRNNVFCNFGNSFLVRAEDRLEHLVFFKFASGSNVANLSIPYLESSVLMYSSSSLIIKPPSYDARNPTSGKAFATSDSI